VNESLPADAKNGPLAVRPEDWRELGEQPGGHDGPTQGVFTPARVNANAQLDIAGGRTAVTTFDYPRTATGARLLPKIDTHLLGPSRLRVMAALATTPAWCRVTTVRDTVDVPRRQIYRDVHELAGVKYVAVKSDPAVQGGKGLSVRITPRGRDALRAHALAVTDIIAHAESLVESGASGAPQSL
jgi:hypothetical protein